MNKLVFAVAFLLVVPALCAQQTESKHDVSQSAPQANTQPAQQNSNAQGNLPESLRPGHPLDPADVDILTGKRNREMEVSRYDSLSSSIGLYGGAFDSGMLPLSEISSPFFFSRWQSRGFRRRGFGPSRFRGTR